MTSFEGRDEVCTIIGAGPNLGRAVARRFAEGGYAVALVGRQAAPLDAMTTELAGDGHRAIAVAADAASTASMDLASRRIAAELGRTRVLVYNAAVINRRHPRDLGADDLARELEVNAVGALRAVQAFVPALGHRPDGRVVLSGGGAGIEPRADYVSLSMGKAALRALAFALEQELAPEGIHVATATICGGIREGTSLAPDLLAERYWDLHAQDPAEWEVETVFR